MSKVISPELFDIVELLVNMPEANLRAGDRGAIVEQHSDRGVQPYLLIC